MSDAAGSSREPSTRRPDALAAHVGRLIGLLVASLVVGLFAILAAEYFTVERSLIRETHRHIAAVASTLATTMNGAVHAEGHYALPRDAFSTWRDAPPAIRALHARFRGVEESSELGTPVYSLRIRSERLEAVKAAPDRLHPGAMEFLVTSAPAPYWRHTYDYRPEMGPTLFEGRASLAHPYEDEHGAWLSAYAPIRAADGRIVGLVETDQRLDVLKGELQVRLLQRWGIEVLALGALLAIFFVFTRRTLGSIAALERAASRMAAGDYQTPVQVDGEGPVQALAHSLEAARERTAEAMAAALDMAETRSSFLARMSHEIRTPMNGVMGLARQLQDVTDSPEARELSHHIEDSARQLLTVINQILEVSRLEAGAVRIDVGPVDLRKILNQVAAVVRPIMMEKGLTFEAEFAPDLPRLLEGDGPRIRQVLLNLLGNAAKYTDEGGVSVRVERAEDDLILIEVEDSGRGIAPEDRAHLFDAYRRTDRRGHDGDGTGLGLAITAEIVRLMGGHIDLHSELGVGTAFRIELTLPIYSGPAQPESQPMLAIRPLDARVLVADDNAVNRLVATRTAERFGCTVIAVDDGDVALERLRAEPFDCLLLDLHMPRLDGLSVTRAIRQDPALAALPILMVTAGVMPDERDRCLEAGVDAFVPKPFTSEALYNALQRCLGEHSVPPAPVA